MMKVKFEEIDKTRKILGLDKEATIYEIKEHYYKLLKQFYDEWWGKLDM